MKQDPSKIYEIVDRNRERYIDSLRELVQLYPEGEENLQRHISEIMESLGCEVDLLALEPTT
ncbi:MAG TPA: hypothetical protein VMW22_09760, partial [Candidatus Desulfaltia sp.]|nr:hypothetical protein [Candidatus Desulfaltia sp.]